MATVTLTKTVAAAQFCHPSPARTDSKSPIFGMPILDVDKANNVIVMKRSMKSGFAGIDNPLFYEPKTAMLFGDAKQTAEKLVSAVKEV